MNRSTQLDDLRAAHRTTWHTDGRVSWRSCSCGWTTERVNKLDALYVLEGDCLAYSDELELLRAEHAEADEPIDYSAGMPQEDRDR